MKTTATDLIEKAGGEETVAAACNITLDAIRKWREAGRVPSKHWIRVAELSKLPLASVATAKVGPRRAA